MGPRNLLTSPPLGPPGQMEFRSVCDLLRDCLRGGKVGAQVEVLLEKLSLYEEKLVIYEKIIQSCESSKDKQDIVLKELKLLRELSLTRFSEDKLDLEKERGKLARERKDMNQVNSLFYYFFQ